MGTDTAAETVRTSQLWRLDAAPGELSAAAGSWRGLAEVAGDLGRRAGDSGALLLASWQGEAATAYRDHHGRVVGSFASVSTVAGRIAALVDAAAATLATAQDHLDDGWRRLVRSLPGAMSMVDGRVVFTPADPAQAATIRAAIRDARDIRGHADARLAGIAGEFSGVWQELAQVRSFTTAAVDPQGVWSAPDEGFRPGVVLLDGDRVIVNGTGRADGITVRMDPITRQQVVTVDGVVRRFPAGLEVVVRAGGGNDLVVVEPGTSVRVTLLGGEGDDTIRGGDGAEVILGLWGNDTISGGRGDDVISGGAGGDYVDGQAGDDRIEGGTDTDTLYGGAGADRISGGSDLDYVDGGAGDDRLDGGSAQDVVFGGRGDDVVTGGGGDDALYGGAGRDTIAGGAGTDRAFGQADDAVQAERPVRIELADAGGFIRVEGSPEFVTRVESDLDALRSSPRGEAMLAALQHSHDADPSRTLFIRETRDRNGFAWPVLPAVVEYNPTFDDLNYSPPVPPVVVLFHELAHVQDIFAGTQAQGIYTGADNPRVPNLEREAVGLPIDDDGNPATPARLYPAHPFALTENGLREELGLRPRLAY